MNGKAVIREAGFAASLQSLSGRGLQNLGLPDGGPADSASARRANQLLGNSDDAAVLELALTGMQIQFKDPCLLSVTGNACTASLNDSIQTNNLISIRKNDVLDIRPGRTNNFTYIGMAGGWHFNPVLESPSMSFWFKKNTLSTGDTLSFVPFHADGLNHVEIRQKEIRTDLIDIADGPESHLFSGADWAHLLAKPLRVSASSGKMATVLMQEKVKTHDVRIHSSPCCPGFVQWTPGGQILVLQVESQTIGGYPRIGYVTEYFRNILVQKPAGQYIRFRKI